MDIIILSLVFVSTMALVVGVTTLILSMDKKS